MRLADELGCPTLGVLAGSRLAGVSMVIQLNTFRENLAWALPRAAAAGRTLTLELLNPDDAPRYLLTDPTRTRALLEAVGDPALRLQFDTYEFGRMVPDVAASFRELAPFVGHVDVGDVAGPPRTRDGRHRMDRLLCRVGGQRIRRDGWPSVPARRGDVRGPQLDRGLRARALEFVLTAAMAITRPRSTLDRLPRVCR